MIVLCKKEQKKVKIYCLKQDDDDASILKSYKIRRPTGKNVKCQVTTLGATRDKMDCGNYQRKTGSYYECKCERI